MMTRAPPRVNAIAAVAPSPDAEAIATAHIPSNELMQTLSSFYGALASSTSCVWHRRWWFGPISQTTTRRANASCDHLAKTLAATSAAQDMPDEGVVGLVVDQIVEGHEPREQRQRPDHADLEMRVSVSGEGTIREIG